MENNQIKIKEVKNEDILFLYDLLLKRDPKVNISHRIMPSLEEHKKFVNSKPYKKWNIIYLDNQKIGSYYLSKNNEIGITILPKFQKKKIGTKILEIMFRENGNLRYLANVSPINSESQKFFIKNGFKLIQYTYEFDLRNVKK